MPKQIVYDGLRKVNITVCIPEYLKKALDDSQNKSELVTLILEENSSRLMCGDVQKAMEYKKKQTKKRIMDELKSLSTTSINVDTLTTQLTVLSNLRNELKSTQLSLKQLNTETNQVTADLNLIKKELKDSIKTIIEESYSELE